jgi:hypothetical protein
MENFRRIMASTAWNRGEWNMALEMARFIAFIGSRRAVHGMCTGFTIKLILWNVFSSET